MISIFTFASVLSRLEPSPITTAKRAKVQSEIKRKNQRKKKDLIRWNKKKWSTSNHESGSVNLINIFKVKGVKSTLARKISNRHRQRITDADIEKDTNVVAYVSCAATSESYRISFHLIVRKSNSEHTPFNDALTISSISSYIIYFNHEPLNLLLHHFIYAFVGVCGQNRLF